MRSHNTSWLYPFILVILLIFSVYMLYLIEKEKSNEVRILTTKIFLYQFDPIYNFPTNRIQISESKNRCPEDCSIAEGPNPLFPYQIFVSSETVKSTEVELP